MNNREFKFRAWDKVILKMTYDNFTISPKGDLSFYWQKESFHSANSILMQFTGLKDVNGKDIFEGDIVEIRDEYFKIYFNQRSAGFRICKLGMHESGNEFISNVINELEVIGNIFENPDITNPPGSFRCKLKTPLT